MKQLLSFISVLLVLASCTVTPRYRTQPTNVPIQAPSRPDIIQVAKSYIGTPYRPGGATRRGMDCSGLVVNVYRQFDIRLPRTSLAQSQAGIGVTPAGLKPGDLVFFKISRKPVSHVGIYIGGGRFIHVSSRARQVRIDHLNDRYFRDRFVVARRVLDY